MPKEVIMKKSLIILFLGTLAVFAYGQSALDYLPSEKDVIWQYANPDRQEFIRLDLVVNHKTRGTMHTIHVRSLRSNDGGQTRLMSSATYRFDEDRSERIELIANEGALGRNVYSSDPRAHLIVPPSESEVVSLERGRSEIRFSYGDTEVNGTRYEDCIVKTKKQTIQVTETLETSSIMREFYAKGVGLVKQDFPETLQDDSPVKEEVLLVKKRPASSAASQE
jgi:hypothetical protein